MSWYPVFRESTHDWLVTSCYSIHGNLNNIQELSTPKFGHSLRLLVLCCFKSIVYYVFSQEKWMVLTPKTATSAETSCGEDDQAVNVWKYLTAKYHQELGLFVAYIYIYTWLCIIYIYIYIFVWYIAYFCASQVSLRSCKLHFRPVLYHKCARLLHPGFAQYFSMQRISWQRTTM